MTTPLLSATHMRAHFGGVLAINDLSFDVRQGEVFTLMGPNGAGKTTVLNLISRIATLTTGEITFQGSDGMRTLTALPPHAIAPLGIARTFQDITLWEQASVLDNLLLGRHAHRATNLWQDLSFNRKAREAEQLAREQAEEVLAFLGLQACRDALVTGLSYGIRKAVEIARALCTQPRLLLLDEPSSGLNAEETKDLAFCIQKIQQQRGVTVLMAEHGMVLASQVSDRVLAMSQGQALALGSPRDVQNNTEAIEAHLGSVDDVSSLRRNGHGMRGTTRPGTVEL